MNYVVPRCTLYIQVFTVYSFLQSSRDIVQSPLKDSTQALYSRWFPLSACNKQTAQDKEDLFPSFGSCVADPDPEKKGSGTGPKCTNRPLWISFSRYIIMSKIEFWQTYYLIFNFKYHAMFKLGKKWHKHFFCSKLISNIYTSRIRIRIFKTRSVNPNPGPKKIDRIRTKWDRIRNRV